MSDDVKLEDRLGCFGYFGFGGGYAMARRHTHGETYCSAGCRQGKKCWERHRTRVRTILPAVSELADEVARDGFRGHEYMLELMKRTGTTMEDQCVEPYVLVMTGNIEDGINVAESGQTKDRGPFTLTWPLIPLRYS